MVEPLFGWIALVSVLQLSSTSPAVEPERSWARFLNPAAVVVAELRLDKVDADELHRWLSGYLPGGDEVLGSLDWPDRVLAQQAANRPCVIETVE